MVDLPTSVHHMVETAPDLTTLPLILMVVDRSIGFHSYQSSPRRILF
ncbi:hypothetical protein MNBD_NITROSPINAE01-1389 [hydrothermal vent metagenome]|uniref:Uncharacterized protein n=1 Tax=hydrothermal vent metagenome TaxID=652676 RepID=A0A3B1C1W0_9ZZZZ